MKKIKGKEIINVINALKEKGLSTIGQGDVLTLNTLKKQSGDIWRLFDNFFHINEKIGTEDFLNKSFDGLFDLALYYYFFYKAYDKFPFNLARVFSNYVKKGDQFGLNEFYICTKSEVKGSNLIISTMFCNNAMLPQFNEEKTELYNFNIDEKEFFKTSYDFDWKFRYKNYEHYPKRDYFDGYGGLELIEAIEASISVNKKALEIIKGLYSNVIIH